MRSDPARMRRLTATVVVTVTAAFAAPAAAAQDDPGEPPEGYAFCGYDDFEGGWADDPPDGAFTVVFARGMTCTAARRNYKRVRYTRSPPYRPLRTGYRCRTIASAYEFADVRCSKRGRASTAFRWRTGS